MITLGIYEKYQGKRTPGGKVPVIRKCGRCLLIPVWIKGCGEPTSYLHGHEGIHRAGPIDQQVGKH